MMANDAAESSKLVCRRCKQTFISSVRFCPDDGMLLVHATTNPMIGSTVSGLYKIESVLGRGGTSIIYGARHELMDRQVAIKMLLWSGDALHDEKKVGRFHQEARMTSRLNHPNIATLYDFGTSVEGQPYLVMEYLEGESLDSLIKTAGVIELTRAVKLFVQICDAIEHAHQKGVIHRDLKPSNVLVSRTESGEESVKVVDFGIAEIMPTGQPSASHGLANGSVFGSPLYMSPEQCLNKSIDSRCDIYSMGVTMFQALTGRLPFIGDTLVEVMTKHISKAAPKLASVNARLVVPETLEAIVQQALRKVPSQRQLSMAKLKEQLMPLLRTVPERETLLINEIGLLIVDDNEVIVEAIKHLVYKFDDVMVVGVARNGRDAVSLASELKPDIVLMDLEMPEIDGLEAALLIKKNVPQSHLIMMASHDNEQDIINSFRAGADGFILKKFESNTLPLAFRAVMHGSTWLDPSISSNVLNIYRQSAPEIMDRAAAVPATEARKDAPDDVSFALSLAASFVTEQKFEAAESLYRLSLAVLEKTKGPSNPEILKATLPLADLYRVQDKLAQAEPLLFRSLELQTQSLGSNHTSLSLTLEKIGDLCALKESYAEAERYLHSAYSIRETSNPSEHVAIAIVCAKLADVYTKQEKFGQADHFIQVARKERAK